MIQGGFNRVVFANISRRGRRRAGRLSRVIIIIIVVIVINVIFVGGQDFPGQGINIIVILKAIGFKLDLVDPSAVILVKLDFQISDCRSRYAGMIQGSFNRVVFADVGRQGRIIIIVVILVGGQDFSGQSFDIVIVLFVVGLELDLVDPSAVIIFKLNFQISGLRSSNTGMIQGDFNRVVFADKNLGAGSPFNRGVFKLDMPGPDQNVQLVDRQLGQLFNRIFGIFADKLKDNLSFSSGYLIFSRHCFDIIVIG